MKDTQEQDNIAHQEKQQGSSMTKRISVDEMENILYKTIPVLDHGFVRVVDYMGSDDAIVQAARVSYGRGTKKKTEDRGLIHYLMRHRHSTPFEMCEVKLHLKMPMFVARQWIRHRTANINEYSARYSILDNEFYVPQTDAISVQSAQNNQGRGDALTQDHAQSIQELIRSIGDDCYGKYQFLLNEDHAHQEHPGIARELARMILPVNFYTQMYWKIDLHNLLHFLSLRADPHAQAEIRSYAEVLLNIVEKWVPVTYEAFLNYRKNGSSLSQNALLLLKKKLNGENPHPESVGMSNREWQELLTLFPELER